MRKSIIYGDSLAGPYGIGAHPAWSRQLEEKAGTGVVQVICKNGYTVSDLIESLSRDVLSLAPEAVILLCGTNDALTMRKAEDILSSVEFLCSEISTFGARPVWLMPPQIDAQMAARTFGDPLPVYEMANDELNQLRQLTRTSFAGKAGTLLTIDLEELCRGYARKFRTPIHGDGIHFTPLFHDFLAEHLERILFQDPPISRIQPK